MEKKLNKTGKDINKFLKNFLKKQRRTELITSMNYGLFPGGKKIRSKIIVDVGKIFSVPYYHLVRVGAAVNVFMHIHLYTMICHVWIMTI